MCNMKLIKRLCSLLMAVILTVSVASVPVLAADGEITENDTYVLDRDANGESLYLYQSPCMLGYDIDNKYGGNGVPIQTFVFTMYNTLSGEYFPTYCTDINITAVQGADYRRLNLEDSPFSGSAAGLIRAILQKGFYIIPQDETDAEHEARVNAKVAELGKAAGVENLTVGEAIAATQAAIWQAAHGSVISFPKFCRYVFKPSNTKYVDLCSYSELKSKDNTLINTTIEAVYDYLLSLEPVAATSKAVSSSSFVKLQSPEITDNGDGTCDISVDVTVDVDMVSGDSLTLKAQLNENYTSKATLVNGKQTINLTIQDVPAELASGEVKLSVSGYQTVSGYFYFDAVGNREASQSMVGYNNSRLPVYAEVVATESRALNIYKSTNSGNSRKPLEGIVFDIFPVATMEEYQSGAVTLPDATEYSYPALAEYTVITDANGYATLDFTNYGLPDGVYLIVERQHPSIVAPIDPFYLYVPTTNAAGNGYDYEITIRPKNDVKGGVRIEKDVISVGNDEATVDAYAAHTWIIGATIPEDISDGKSYVITDTLDNRLDYVGNVKVYLETTDGTSAVELTDNTDYKLTVTNQDSLSEGNPSDSFSIELTSTGMNKIATTIGSNSYSNYILRVYFDAQINANAEMGTQIPNQAELEYINAVNFEFNAESDIPVVYTGGANLLKVDATNTSKVLAGADFEVYRLATAEEVSANGDNLVTINGVSGKVVKASFFGNPELEGSKVTSVTSDENGKISIYGLAYGKYYLVETEAPDGYTLLDDVLELTINASSHTEEKTITVENKIGTILPSTGGIGTTIYTVSGIALVSISCLLLYMNKRRFIES